VSEDLERLLFVGDGLDCEDYLMVVGVESCGGGEAREGCSPSRLRFGRNINYLKEQSRFYS
jgi:hypothetical protein